LIYCIIFNPAIDVCYTLKNLEPASTSLDVPAAVFPAGKSLNVAKVIRSLSEEVAVLGIMPEDDEPRFNRYLDALGIGHTFYNVEGSVRINVTIDETAQPQATHINSRGTPLPARAQDESFEFICSHLQPGDICVLSGSLPAGFDANAYLNLIQYCQGRNIVCLLDTRGDALKMGVRGRPTMVKPNLSELEDFFGEQIQGVHHIAFKGKRLIDLGVEYAFISLGEDGMIAIHENDCLLCSVPPVEAIDTVGCGDALVAGITVGYSRKFSFHETCRLAIACAASNATHSGPGVIDRDEVGRLMEEVIIKAV
jgi:1-phosphofructokinase family hexose kinase